ncbi:hypothetical protein A8990_10584 [Paenibacillus taihuensis]|uniref:Uncharacterized protein n=1 Tax=Paenibacillus taihuensis TaxID=1156355 RepID=A0A3D9SLA8_9BACL|nr:hypothetical protein A8990_10584 [Paenibacillus taihuensis]
MEGLFSFRLRRALGFKPTNCSIGFAMWDISTHFTRKPPFYLAMLDFSTHFRRKELKKLISSRNEWIYPL